METNKLKKRPPFPFETIAVAVAFSPRLEGLLTEAASMAELYKSKLILIHVGEKDEKKNELLDTLLNQTGMKKLHPQIIWKHGDPTDTILSECKENKVDLLVLGALEKENLYKYYVGSIARNISRKAKCSVLLLTNPLTKPKKLKKIAINAIDNPKCEHTIATSIYLAKAQKIKEITVIQEVDIPTFALSMQETSTNTEAQKIKKELTEEEHQKLMCILDKFKEADIEINLKTVKGKPGYAVANYAKSKGYDLLVINSPDSPLGFFDRIFTHDTEYILADLPCNLLIVHSRV